MAAQVVDLQPILLSEFIDNDLDEVLEQQRIYITELPNNNVAVRFPVDDYQEKVICITQENTDGHTLQLRIFNMLKKYIDKSTLKFHIEVEHTINNKMYATYTIINQGE